MAKPRVTVTHRAFVGRVNRSGGNDYPERETDAQSFTRIEDALVRIEAALATQFQRMADMQVLIDRLTAERNR